MAMTTPSPAPAETDPSSEDAVGPTGPWLVIVWDDPVNLMSYVTFVLKKVFGYPSGKAHSLMMKVHTEGKAAVASGPREHMEIAVDRLQAHSLWATMERS